MFRSLLDLIAPERCTECDAPGTVWCLECRSRLRGSVFELQSGGSLSAVTHAEPAMMRAISRWKDHGQRGFLPVFAEMIVKQIESSDQTQNLHLVTIPSRRSKSRARGFEPMPALARTVAALHGEGWTYSAGALEWTRTPHEQRGLSDSARRANLGGTMQLAAPLNRPVVLLDDVVTSGATISEALRAIARNQTQPVSVVVLAVPRKVFSQDLVKSVARAPTAV